MVGNGCSLSVREQMRRYLCLRLSLSVYVCDDMKFSRLRAKPACVSEMQATVLPCHEIGLRFVFSFGIYSRLTHDSDASVEALRK